MFFFYKDSGHILYITGLIYKSLSVSLHLKSLTGIRTDICFKYFILKNTLLVILIAYYI